MTPENTLARKGGFGDTHHLNEGQRDESCRLSSPRGHRRLVYVPLHIQRRERMKKRLLWQWYWFLDRDAHEKFVLVAFPIVWLAVVLIGFLR